MTRVTGWVSQPVTLTRSLSNGDAARTFACGRVSMVGLTDGLELSKVLTCKYGRTVFIAEHQQPHKTALFVHRDEEEPLPSRRSGAKGEEPFGHISYFVTHFLSHFSHMFQCDKKSDKIWL